MNKTVMYILGASAIAGASYYMGLPKEKKNDLKKLVKDKMKIDKDLMEEMM